MSHVAKIELQIKDLGALEIACRALGLELVRGQTTYKWYGRSVGDYALPEGFTADELGRCAHAIKIPGNDQAYEIGVVTRRDGKPGFQLLWDFYNGGFGLTEKIGQNAEKLKREYSAAVATKWYSAQGYRVTRQDVNGKIKLSASRY